jgi:hypothetical protein
MAANKKSRKGNSHGSKSSSTSASSPVRAWSIGGRVYYAASRRGALQQRAEELGLG